MRMDLNGIGIGDALGTDYFHLREQMTAQQADYLARTREFVRTEVQPTIIDYWEKAEFPWPLIEKLGPVGIIGDGIVGYGCPDMDPMSAGLIAMEMTRGDGSMGTFLVVHGGLAMKSIFMLGSEEQKQKWLPPMARLEKIGAFALTEPDHGSDSVALETSARRDGDSYVINGAKKWIGNGTIADVVVVWARDVEDGQVKGFLVEKGTPGYNAKKIEHKVPLRAVWQAEIALDEMRIPAQNKLPGGEHVQGHGQDPRRHAALLRVGRARVGGRRVRRRPELRQESQAVRQAAGRPSDHPATPGEDAGRRYRDAAVLPADDPARRAGPARRHPRRAWQVPQHDPRPELYLPRREICWEATESCSTTM